MEVKESVNDSLRFILNENGNVDLIQFVSSFYDLLGSLAVLDMGML